LNLVIDASVLIKFYIPEILSDKAEELLDRVEQGDMMLLAPDLIYPEAGNILWKKQRMKELTRPEVEEIADAIISLPLKIEASKPFLSLAMDIAIAYRITVYDAIYISMARVYEIKMMTADRKLLDAVAKTDLKECVAWLGSQRW
jgi:predicted nucleic acid-binding protein